MSPRATATISFYWDEEKKRWMLIAATPDNRVPVYRLLDENVTAALDRTCLERIMTVAGEVLEGYLW